MTDIQKLKALAEAFPADLDFDTNSTPFFNGPDGESLGGESAGYYSVYGQPFDIEGEQYDGTEYVSICTKEFAEFVCSARAGVLELVAEIERLERKNSNQAQTIREYSDLVMGGDVSLGMLRADIRVTTGERDQLKAENEALRKSLLEASEEVAAWGAYASEYFQEKHDLAGCVARIHDTAMSKESSHG